MDVDFLIVAALKDEAAEIAKLLIEKDQEGPYIVGKVQRWKGRGEYRVAIVNLYDGMGALEAGPATQGAIADLHPRAVLMTGIAAGFEESRAEVRSPISNAIGRRGFLEENFAGSLKAKTGAGAIVQ